MKRFACGLVLLSLYFLSAVSIAMDTAYHQTVDGVAIYIGIVPAELVRGHPPEHPEGQMHGGPQFNESHLTVALYEARSGQRIRNAEVHARITNPRGVHVTRKLEPMLIADQPTFGNYLPMSGDGPYRIELEIRMPGAVRAITASFSWSRS